jgi:hypothetical protein
MSKIELAAVIALVCFFLAVFIPIGYIAIRTYKEDKNLYRKRK